MSNNKDPQLQFEVEQFYYHEADLLDERQYQTWLALITDDLVYLMPGRASVQGDIALRGKEAFLASEAEFEGEGVNSLPLREENAMIMAFRAQRACKPQAWASNPPARTRRSVSNVRIELLGENSYQVKSNLLLYYSRHRDDNHIYSGQRIDTLRRVDGVLKIARREIRLDWNVIDAPTVGLFF